MSRPIITLLTDFGQADGYVAQMKGVLLGINPQLQLVDVTHAIPAQDVVLAADVLDETVDSFPRDTIHLAVVDPGVGTGRRMVGVELGRQRFVAPDNGVLSQVVRRFPLGRCVRLTTETFWRTPISSTFHGRDVMAPVAAHWSLGIDLAEFGEPLDTQLLVLPAREPTRIPGGLEGEVIRQDSFGNLVTNINASLIPEEVRDRVNVEIGSRSISGVQRYYSQKPAGTLLALIGSTGRLEIAVNQGHAAETLNIRIGDRVRMLGLQIVEEK